MEWINVKDRLPTECVAVIVCVTEMNGFERRMSISMEGWHTTLNSTGWCCASLGDEEAVDIVVTHWMPFPNPPETV